MAAIDDQIAAAQAAIAACLTAADALTSTVGDLSAAVRSTAVSISDAKDAVDAIEPPAAPTVLTVLDYGAVADGATDCTNAFNAAIAAGDGRVPAGTYLINPVRADNSGGIRMSAGQTLVLEDGAILKAKANSAPRYYIIKGVGNGINIIGTGKVQIIGDRLAHTYTTGSTHEWGYGISVSGNSCTIRGVQVSNCTGDGIGISGVGNIVDQVVSTQNRRQGMSCFDVDNLEVTDSEFSLTGALLTDAAAPNGPCAGVDMEPDNAGTASATFTRCKFNGNRAGFLAWLRSEVGGTISVTLTDCQMVGNANGVHAKALAGSIAITVTGSTLANNRGSGIRIETSANFTINDNLFDSPTERTDFTLTGTDSRTKYDINRVTGAPAPVVGTNKYV